MIALKGRYVACSRRFTACIFLFFAVLTHLPRTFAAADVVQQLADLNPGVAGSYPSNFTSFSGSVYFSAYTLNTGRELWKFDGTNVTLAANINDTVDDLGNGIFEGNDSVPAWFT